MAETQSNVAAKIPISEAREVPGSHFSYMQPKESMFPVRVVRYAFAKRLLDLTCALIGLTVGFPIFLIIGILIKLTSQGPIFFKQTRVGVGGREFTCYKFRSMFMDAEARLKDLQHLNEATGPVFKIRQDPRITPVGRVIRKLSLDELPQLINVLVGDMSVVGPRPPLPREVRTYDAYQRQRLSVKPGLTCLWQISGRSNIGFERWVELDLDYIATMSFWGDLKIILLTIPAVVTARGAH